MGPYKSSAPDSLQSWGWDELWRKEFEPYDRRGWYPARVTSIDRRSSTVCGDGPERRVPLAGRLLREESATWPAVGDWVAIAARGDSEVEVVEVVLPRRSQFVRQAPGRRTQPRVVAANIDTVFLMSAVTEDFNLRRLERYLVVAWESGSRPVILLTKSDLMADVLGRLTAAASVAPGVPIHAISCLGSTHLEVLDNYLSPGRTVAMLGSSGVGKSTLINRLMGNELLATAPVRSRDGRGRHTTSRQLLLQLPGGALVIDTPGLRQLKPWEGEEGLGRTFLEVEQLAQRCRYGDCSHRTEPGCAVQEALLAGRLSPARFENYLKLQQELAFQSRRRDAHQAREEKQTTKSVHKSLRRRIAEKTRWRE